MILLRRRVPILLLPGLKTLLTFGVAVQATVQAALASLPLEAVTKAYPVGSPEYAQYHAWATDALTTAVFEVIISGTLGCLLVRWLSPLLLPQARRTLRLHRPLVCVWTLSVALTVS